MEQHDNICRTWQTSSTGKKLFEMKRRDARSAEAPAHYVLHTDDKYDKSQSEVSRAKTKHLEIVQSV